MAFSTQKDFLKIGFLNDPLQLNYEQSLGNSLSRYTACMDPRSWIMDKERKVHYLSDLVAYRREDGICDGSTESTPGTCKEKLREAERKICQLEEENRALKRLMVAQSSSGDANLVAEIGRLRLIEKKYEILKEELDQIQRNCTCGGKKIFCDLKNQQLINQQEHKTK